MSALSRQLLQIEAGAMAPAAEAHGRWTDGAGRLLAGLLGFVCLMPYPALAIGNRTAVQMGVILGGVMLLPMLLTSWSRRPFWVYVVILIPLCLSVLAVALTHVTEELGLSLKTTYVWAMSCLLLVIAQLYAPRYLPSLLTGLALATLLHALIGLWQAYAFRAGEFPLVALYVNPSFLSVQENATTLARYNQRPFGLFPEPSAMASSLAPWVVLWFAQMLGLARFAQPTRRWQRILFVAAAVAGLGLMILSQSGHATITLAAILCLVAAWLLRCRATWRVYLCIVLTLGAAVPGVLALATMSLGDRVSVDNSSWEERSSSLVAGFDVMLHGDLKTILLGLGPGLSSPTMQDQAGLDAVWSVSLSYLYETGLIGLLAALVVAGLLLRTWYVVRYDLVFAMVFLVWLVGITVTTSYEQLLSPWLTLGWLTIWPQVCPPVIQEQDAWLPVMQPAAHLLAPRDLGRMT